MELKTAPAVPVALMWTKYPYILHACSEELVSHMHTVSTCSYVHVWVMCDQTCSNEKSVYAIF